MFTETFVPHANGVTTSILNARRGLFQRGHRVTVYSAGPPVFENESVHYYGGKTFPLYPDFPIAIFPSRAGRRNKRALAQQDPDVVHIHAPGPMGLRGYRAAKRHGKPFLVTYHTVTEPLVRYAPYGWKTLYRVGSSAVDRLLNNRSAIIIAPTHAAKRDLLTKNPDWESKIRVVPTGIDLDAFRPGLDASHVRHAWGFEHGERVMLYLGRTSYEKRIDLLLDAYARLRTAHRDLRFVVAGTGPATTDLKAQVRALGVQDEVRFVGHVPDDQVPAYYNACDVFASASEIETQGLTLLEAMACGAPVAVAGTGGFLDVVRDGHNGYLFPPGSVDGAVHGIELALAAPTALRQRARESALQYGLDHCATLLERAYEAALDAEAEP
jgi:1,2-diacylglycerol 3-alpha-glucosyltransferase